MDILRPKIIRIGNRCYRKNHVETRQQDYEEEEYQTEERQDVYADEICDAELSAIKELKDGTFQLSLEIPSAYFKFIIGKKAETKRRIENETQTQIKIPRQGIEGDIEIIGRDHRGISSARTRIDVLVESARQKQPFTHFLSLPVATSSLQARLQEFKTDVLETCSGDRGIDGSLFQNPLKLHLTLGTLALMNHKEVKDAVGLLEECREAIALPLLSDGPLEARVKGLEYMNDDPNAVDVLYAQVHLVDGSHRLQMLADQLVDRFTSSGLMQKDYDRVKLHITVMNTLFRKDPGATSAAVKGGPRGQPPRESFDAANVLKNYGDYDFGPLTISTVHLSQRYSTGREGYYTCTACLTLSE